MAGTSNVRALTSAPLRNRVRVELSAPASDVWALLRDLARFPEYSSGLQSVEATLDSSGGCREYTCHFKPVPPHDVPVVSREIVRWWDEGRSYASSSGQGDAFGLTNDLNVVEIEPSERGSLVTWSEYFDAEDLDGMRAHFAEALSDIADNLVRRFGGRVVERFVEPASPRAE